MDIFNVNLGLTTQEFTPVAEKDSTEVNHWVVITFDTVPTAGTISLDFDPGINSWIPLHEAQDKVPVQNLEIRFSGFVEKIRVRLSGIVGGSGCKLHMFHASEWFGDGFPMDLFRGMRAITSQNYTEANVKNGVQYQASSYTPALAVGATNDYIVVTGAKPISIKGRIQQWDGAGIRLETYLNPTYTGGTPLTCYNFNLWKPVAGTAQIIVGMTLTDLGTKCAADKNLLGSNGVGNSVISSSAEDTPGVETILAPNSKYLFRTVGLHTVDTQRVAGYVTWYEGDLDLPN